MATSEESGQKAMDESAKGVRDSSAAGSKGYSYESTETPATIREALEVADRAFKDKERNFHQRRPRPQEVQRPAQSPVVVPGLVDGPMGGMNWIMRLGICWESRKPVRREEFKQLASDLTRRIEDAQKSNVVSQMAVLKAQVDRLELYVGLKREQKAIPVEGAARIG